jgi:uncharacterized protein involved in type VI secretion and phage assembly
MNTWLDIYNKCKALDIDQEVTESFNDTTEEFTRRNAEQMYFGIDKDGKEITPGYAESTIRYKKRKGQPYDRVTLRDTGAFHKKMWAVADNDKIFIGSDVEYSDHLAEKYTDKIFGLEREANKEFSLGPFFSVLKRRVESVTGLTFK